MVPSPARVIPWQGETLPTLAVIESVLQAEGLSAYTWSNGPGDRYNAHSHGYSKVIYVVDGSITFGLPVTREHLDLSVGDRLELEAGVVHDAIVGPEGVLCLEAHR